MNIDMNLDWNKITLDDFQNNILAIMKITGTFPIKPLPEKDQTLLWEEHFKLQRDFYMLRQRFDGGEIRAGIEAFFVAYNNLYRIPYWFERLLFDVLKKFDLSEGKERDLSKLLGMKVKQRTGNEYSVAKRKTRDADICIMLIEIKALTGCGVFKCCEVLSCFKKPIEGIYVSYGVPGEVKIPDQPKTIEEIYLKNKDHFEKLYKWTEETVESVESFPSDTFFTYCEAIYAAAKNPSYSFTREDAEKAFTKSLLPLPSKSTKSPPDK